MPFSQRIIWSFSFVLFCLLSSGQTKNDSTEYRRFMDSSKYYQYLKPKEAIRWAEKASYQAGQAGLELSRGHAEFQICRMYTNQGETKTAKVHALEALKIYQDNNFEKGLQKVLLNLGHMHVKEGDYEQAEKYYFDALKIADKIKDTLSEGYIYQGIGNRFYYDKNLEEASKYMLLAEEKLLSLNKKEVLGGLYVNLGNIKQNQDKLSEANDYYTKGYEIFKSQNDLIRQAIVAYNLGDIQLKRNRDREALNWYRIVLDIGTSANSIEDIKFGYLGLSKAYENMGQYLLAFDHLQSYHKIKDSLNELNQQRKVDELEAKYLSEKQDKEAAEKNERIMKDLLDKEAKLKSKSEELNQQNETNRLLWIIGSIIFILLIITYIANQRFKRVNQTIREQNTLIDKSLKEKEILLKEIHHRVKNNLQMISSLLNLQINSLESEEAKYALEDSIGRVRAIASVHTKLYNNAHLAFINIRDYLSDLVSQQFPFDKKGRKIEYALDVADQEINLDTAVPLGLILSELISNSLKHAFDKTESPKILITLHKEKNRLCRLSFKDNGMGLEDDFNRDQLNSLGFEIIYTLSEQLEGEFKHINSREGAHFTLDFKDPH